MEGNLLTPIPTYLTTPASGRVPPPVITSLQELPFRELAWEDFEKLCLRLAQSESDVEHCQLYGTRGQDQEGIDLYARLRKERTYVVYQCKRVRDFGPARIKDAVDEFLSGQWLAKASTFVLCTAESLEFRERADALEEQRLALESRSLTLVVWDSRQLSLKLKDDPKLVNDFFGWAWVQLFCSPEVAASLKDRLDVSQVAELRQELGRFYNHVFNASDPGDAPGPSGNITFFPLQQRFILPDIEETQSITVAGLADNIATAPIVLDEIQNTSSAAEIPNTNTRASAREAYRTVMQRSPVQRWLQNANNSIVLGGPGSGKSTLLRFVLFDLLQQEPQLQLLAEKWGNCLPVWIPFPAWTEKIKNHGDYSLPDVLEDYLRSWGEERLWPLVAQALEDERLLLIVDGLDEWADESSAKRAIDKLQVFIGRRHLPAIVASRPHGFARLGWQQGDWQKGFLAGLTTRQQKEFTKAWFNHRALAHAHSVPEAEEIANRESESFIKELHENASLRELATIPLLLRIFIYFRFHNFRLPQSRFEAYERIVAQLISEHPSNRRRAAQIPDQTNELDDDDIRAILSLIAFELAKNEAAGVISKDEARTLVCGYLENVEEGLGLQHATALRVSRRFLDLGQNTLGVLVERTPLEVGFFHRTFQEYLAAYWISRMPLSDQVMLVQMYCANPQWTEVILALCHMTNRPRDVEEFINAVKRSSDAGPRANRQPIRVLLAEIAFGNFHCPTPAARLLANESLNEIETGDWMPHRMNLVRHALNGLRSTTVRDQVRERIEGWLPCYTSWRAPLIRALAEWTLSPALINCLFRNLHDEEPPNRRAAAATLARVGSGNQSIGERIAGLAARSVDLEARVAAIEALTKGWPTQLGLTEILDDARHSLSPDLRLVAAVGRVLLGMQTEDDLNELLRLSKNSSVFWREDIVTGLIAGWPGSPKIKSLCLEALHARTAGEADIRREIAEAVAIRGYPQDGDVVDALIKRAASEQTFIADHYDLPRYLISNFKGNPKLSDAIDKRLNADQGPIFRLEYSQLAATSSSEAAKDYLLKSLHISEGIQWPAGALLETWGIADSVVASELISIANGSSAEASQIAHLIPSIVEDKTSARDILIRLLKDPVTKQVHFVIDGLKALGPIAKDEEIVTIVLEQIERGGESFRERITGALIANYGNDPRVREIAKEELRNRRWTVDVVASAYPNDEGMAKQIFDLASALPTSLRLAIVSDASIVSNDPTFALELLSKWDQEIDDQVKTEASIRYHTVKRLSRDVVATDLAILQRTLYAHGPDFEQRRQAAFAGCIALNRVDLILEDEGPEKKVPQIPIGFTFSQNAVLLKYILQHWNVLKENLGEKLWQCLKTFDSDSDPLALWSRFGAFLSEYDDPRAEALDFLSTRSERNSTTEILRFLSKVMSHRWLLLEYLLEAVCPTKTRGHDTLGTIIAVEILGECFAGDAETYAQLEQRFSQEPHQWYTANKNHIIIALCEGWPDSQLLERVFQEVRGTAILPNLTAWNVVCVKSAADVVAGELKTLIFQHIGDPTPYWNPHFARPVIRRLRRDPALVKALESSLKNAPSTTEKATVVKLLAAANGMSTQLKDWVTEEIERQLDGAAGPEIGLDLLVGELRPVVHCLLETLSAERQPIASS